MSDERKTPAKKRTADAKNKAARADEVTLEENGVSEASAEASIAALVEAERAAEAEEAVIAEAELAAEVEEPYESGEAAGVGESAESAEDLEVAEAAELGEAVGVDDLAEADEAAEVGEPTDAEAAAEPAPPATSKQVRKPKQPVRKLAVLGSPIGHSKSPALHRAAYEKLGLPWEYGTADVTGDDLAGFIDGLSPEWRGLSLTMPLKQSVIPLADELDRLAEQTGVANTVLLDEGTIRGFNTDVSGIVWALEAVGLESAKFVHILGGGATAASALVAAAELGADRVDIYVRSLERSVWLEPLAHELGLRVRIRPLSQADRSLDIPDLVISTLPGGVTTDALYTDSTRRRSVLLDVSYEPWPSVLATSWQAVGGRVVSGLAMLAHQALLQIRIFVSGDPLQPLDDEDAVLSAMLDAVGIDETGAPLGE